MEVFPPPKETGESNQDDQSKNTSNDSADNSNVLCLGLLALQLDICIAYSTNANTCRGAKSWCRVAIMETYIEYSIGC